MLGTKQNGSEKRLHLQTRKKMFRWFIFEFSSQDNNK